MLLSIKAVDVARPFVAAGEEWKHTLLFSSHFAFLSISLQTLELNEIVILTTAVCG
jgi:hypothetical protein